MVPGSAPGATPGLLPGAQAVLDPDRGEMTDEKMAESSGLTPISLGTDSTN